MHHTHLHIMQAAGANMPPHRKRLLPEEPEGERKPILLLDAAADSNNGGGNGGAGTPTTQASSSTASTPSRAGQQQQQQRSSLVARRGNGRDDDDEREGDGDNNAPWAPAEEMRVWAVTHTLQLALVVALLGLVQALLSAEAIFWLVLATASLSSLTALGYARVRERGLLEYLPASTRQMLLETSLLDWLMDTSMADRLKPYAALSFGGLNAEERAFLLSSLPRDQQQALVAPGLLHALPASMQSLLLPRCGSASSLAAAAGGGCGAGAAAGGGGPGRRRIEELSEAEAAALRAGQRRRLLDGGEEEDEEGEEDVSVDTASVTSDEASEDGAGPALRYARMAILPPSSSRHGVGEGLRPPPRAIAPPLSSSLAQQPSSSSAASAASQPPAASAASAPWPHPSEVEDVTAYVLRRRMLRAWAEATRAGTEAVVAGVREEVRRVVFDRRLIYAGVALSGSALAAQVLGRVASARPPASRAMRVYGSGLAFAGSLALAAYEYYSAASADDEEDGDGYDESEELVAGAEGGDGVALQRRKPGHNRRRRARDDLVTAAQWAAFFVLLVLLRTGRLAPILRRLRLRLFGGGVGRGGGGGFFLGGGKL